jgi:hypothetical protein
MKKLLILITLLVATSLFSNNIYVVNSVSGTLSKIDLENESVNNTYVQLGTTPNLIDIYDDFAYVVNSGDNSVQKIDLTSGNTVSNIYVADSSNPWYAKVKGEFLYVTAFNTNKLYKISLASEEIVAEVEVGQAPEGIEFALGKIYVSCTGGYVNNYQDSQITVLSEDNLEIITSIPTSLNPQYVHLYNGKIYVMCTGNWLDVMGYVEVINPQTDTIMASLNIGGNLGKAAFINNHAYITDAMNTGLYAIDTDTDTILNDSSNPLNPGGSTIASNGQMLAFVNSEWGSNGTVWITDANLENGQSFEVALAPSDVIFQYQAVANSDNSVSPAQISVNAYPNPTSKGLNFQLQGNTRGESHVQIYNLKGQLVDQFTAQENLFRWNSNRINNDNLASGLYFYKITNNNHSLSGKFIILK